MAGRSYDNGFEGIALELHQREAIALESISESLRRIADHIAPPERSFAEVIIPYDQ